MKKILLLVAVVVSVLLYIDSVCSLDIRRADTVTMRSASAKTDTQTVFRGEVDIFYLKSLGVFKITFYCPCEKCCGKTDGITSTGVKAKANHTVAVDPSVIPYGTILYIDGQEYVAEDCGGSIKEKRIDVFCNTHTDAIERGVMEREVFVKQ